MFSAARRAEVQLPCCWLDGPGFEFHFAPLTSSPKRLTVCGGYFLEVKRLEGETQNSLPSSATLRMCGAVPPIKSIACYHAYGLGNERCAKEGRKEGRKEGSKEEEVRERRN